jgi:hypothetical protein
MEDMEQWLDEVLGPLDDFHLMDVNKSVVGLAPTDNFDASANLPGTTVTEQNPPVAETAPSIHTSMVVRRNAPAPDRSSNLAKPRYVTFIT